MQNSTLRTRILDKCGNAAGLQRLTGWSGRKARDITAGRQAPRPEEIYELAAALDMEEAPPEDLIATFLPKLAKQK